MSNIVGYTNGCFDMFHQGHLNLIRSASALCDKFIVGVLTDEQILVAKKHLPTIPFIERLDIIRNIKGVNVAVPVGIDDKWLEWNKYHYDILFVGTDHKGEDVWNKTTSQLDQVGSKVIYLPYTESVSTTAIRERILKAK